MTHWAGPKLGLGVLAVDVSLQPLLVVKSFLAVVTLMIT